LKFSNVDPGRENFFFERSPFGRYAATIANEIEEDNMKLSQISSAMPNLLKSKRFFQYLKVHIFPYWPLLSHAFLDAFGHVISDNTTNAVGKKTYFFSCKIFLNSINSLLKRLN